MGSDSLGKMPYTNAVTHLTRRALQQATLAQPEQPLCRVARSLFVPSSLISVAGYNHLMDFHDFRKSQLPFKTLRAQII